MPGFKLSKKNDRLANRPIKSWAAAKILGVARETLYRWELEGRIKPRRDKNGHRIYSYGKIFALSKKIFEKRISK